MSVGFAHGTKHIHRELDLNCYNWNIILTDEVRKQIGGSIPGKNNIGQLPDWKFSVHVRVFCVHVWICSRPKNVLPERFNKMSVTGGTISQQNRFGEVNVIVSGWDILNGIDRFTFPWVCDKYQGKI